MGVWHLIWLHSWIHPCNLIEELIKKIKLVWHPVVTCVISVATYGALCEDYLECGGDPLTQR